MASSRGLVLPPVTCATYTWPRQKVTTPSRLTWPRTLTFLSNHLNVTAETKAPTAHTRLLLTLRRACSVLIARQGADAVTPFHRCGRQGSEGSGAGRLVLGPPPPLQSEANDCPLGAPGRSGGTHVRGGFRAVVATRVVSQGHGGRFSQQRAWLCRLQASPRGRWGESPVRLPAGDGRFLSAVLVTPARGTGQSLLSLCPELQPLLSQHPFHDAPNIPCLQPRSARRDAELRTPEKLERAHTYPPLHAHTHYAYHIPLHTLQTHLHTPCHYAYTRTPYTVHRSQAHIHTHTFTLGMASPELLSEKSKA